MLAVQNLRCSSISLIVCNNFSAGYTAQSVVILSPGQSHAASLQRQQRVAEQVGSRRPMVEVAAGVVIGDTNGHIISVEMKKMHGERKKNEEKDCHIVFSFYIWAFLSNPRVLRSYAL